MQYSLLRPKDIPIIRSTLLLQQNNKCPICNRDVISPCLDHKHATKKNGISEIDGMVRQVLCRACNSLVGAIENNHKRFGISYDDLPLLLNNISTYLTNQPYTNMVHPTEKSKIPK